MIRTEALTKRFGDRAVLDSVDLAVPEGEIVSVMGGSGGGKTTLLRCIAGLLVPTSGRVEVDGVDVVRNPEEARRHLGMVFQSAALFDYLSVKENVLFGARRWSKRTPGELDALAREMLALVGLEGTEGLMPAQLSGGMRKRVGIARALANRPRVMLYDEPTTGLDPVTTYQIDRLIVDLRDRLGVTSLVVSHDVSSVFRVSDKVAFLEGGRLAYFGDPDQFEARGTDAMRELVRKAEARSFLEPSGDQPEG
ncbi:MAG: ATP-binding cassette domain-containing protein [Fimbriimonadales bacterium]|nr:ATP-binding cassette domain-containing protein [Fimbriimonadales bacterium]